MVIGNYCESQSFSSIFLVKMIDGLMTLAAKDVRSTTR